MINTSSLIEGICHDAPSFVEFRRNVHAHPELSYQEHRTSELIAQMLLGWGVPVHRQLGKTGLVGIIKSGTGDRAIGLRADMDALPILERNSFDHASLHKGRMHACGHDGHIAMLLSAAKYLKQHAIFDGTVYVIFQPAEEDGGGAQQMIKEGIFQLFPMQAIFGIHNWPGLALGKFAIKAGPVFASGNRFRILINGRGGHAAMPQHSVDPVPVACQVVQAFQTIITRNKGPLDAAVLSVTLIRGGDAINVVPDFCEIQGTVRTFSGEITDMIERRMRKITEFTCHAFEATAEFEFHRYYPSTHNDPVETGFVQSVLIDLVGQENVLPFEPTMASEDFSFYLLAKPGCYFLIGNGDGAHRSADHGDGPCVLHNPSYDFNDGAIPLGASMWVRLVEKWFGRAGGEGVQGTNT